MTEADWHTCADPVELFQYLSAAHFDRAHGRRMHLFGCGCVRQVWPLLADGRSRRAVEVGERWADRAASWTDMEAAHEAAREAVSDTGSPPARAAAEAAAWVARTRSWDVAYGASEASAGATGGIDTAAYASARRGQCELLRDLFGNPFRPAVLDDSWKTLTVMALAKGVYDERAFDRLPILADALQETGCDDDQLLDHLRGPGPHVRGCWALDLVLGKT